MTLTLGQLGCLSSIDILPAEGAFSKGFGITDYVNSLTYPLRRRDKHRLPPHEWVPTDGQSSWIVTAVIATG